MPYAVLLTAGTESDLEAIYEHIAETDSRPAADRVLDRLLDLSFRLAELPERGTHPKELLAVGIREYRQVVFKPYRVIYRIVDERIFIVLIADGRRDLPALLARRLLAAP